MKTLRNSSIIAVAVLALALLVASPMAFAGSVTYSSNIIPNTTSIGSSMGTLNVNQFNNISGTYAGDTLDDMIITLYGSGSVIFTAELVNNPGGTGGNLTINSLSTNVTLTASGASAPVNLNLTGTYTPSGGPIVITTPGLSGEIVTPSTAIPLGHISSGVLTDPTDLANFTGTGLESFLLSGSAPVTYSGNVSDGYLAATGGTTLAGAAVTVEYDFSSAPPPPGVPEPGTLGLLGTGLLGLAGMLRNRFSKSN
jgi:hypothetical protein